jgi:hypothetical protein
MSSAARAFEQRSAAAVAQVVAEIDNAAFDAPDTPPSPSATGGGLDFRAAQIEKDAKMAEELQREEYQKEEARTERRRQRRDAAAAEQNASWSDWLMGTSPTNNSNSNSASAPTPARSTGGARVAQPSNSMFSCVAQSITSVMGPQESQVRGVDSTSLL